jgi:outer membrane protein insertion porin family
LPSFLPEDYGLNFSLFSDFGTLGYVDDKQQLCLFYTRSGVACPIRDNLALRASAGLSIGWKSPFGPIQIDLGVPFLKTDYDRPQLIHFTAGTGF